MLPFCVPEQIPQNAPCIFVDEFHHIQSVNFETEFVGEGWLSAYAQTPTDATIDYRISIGDVPVNVWEQYDLVIAVLDCRLIGKEIILRTEKGDFYGIVFDCAGSSDGTVSWMNEHNILAEVDWYFWQEHPELIGTKATLELIHD
jgi:hypothetical protein